MPADSATFNGQTPLMWAALQGHVQICRLLLDNGADIRKKDSLGTMRVGKVVFSVVKK